MPARSNFSRHGFILLSLLVFWVFPPLTYSLPKDGKAAPQEKAPSSAQKQPTVTQAPRHQSLFFDDANINATIPQPGGAYRAIGPQRLISTGVPYVNVRVGHPETAGGNNHMRRQVKASPSGVVHMVYRVFDSDTNWVVQTAADSNRNGFYFYNAYDCGGSNALQFGSEDVPLQYAFPGDTRPRKIQLGGIFIKPGSNIPIAYGSNYILRTDIGQAGRYDGSPRTLGLMRDSAECAGVFTMDTSTTYVERAFHPVMWTINESTYVATTYRVGFPNLGRFWATRDRGLTWVYAGTNMGTASAWYNSFELTGSGNNVYFVSMTDPNDLTAFLTTERPVYVKVTYNPATGTFSGITSPPIDIPASAGYSDPGFLGTMLDIAATMVGDTLHVAWMTWNNWMGQNIPGPGGQVMHAAVYPDGDAEVHKIADVNIDGRYPHACYGPFFGFISTPWSQIELSYDETNQRLYCLWVQPPPDDNPNDANYEWGDYEVTGTVAVEDIFCSVSPNNGLGWDEPQNVTQTNSPGCDGSVADECEHEYWFSCDDRVSNDTIWTVAVVNKYPGIQEAAIASGITPCVGPVTAYRDEFRLYKMPARTPVLTARGALGPAPGDTIQLFNIKMAPGALTPVEVNLQLKNIGLLDFVTDSIKIGADLNSSGLATTSNFSANNPVPVGGGYNFKLFLDASAVTPAQAGTHSGLLQVFGHSTSPASSMVLGQAIGVYIIPTICLNRKALIHSATNESHIGNQGAISDGWGMSYPPVGFCDPPGPCNAGGRIYDGAVWIANSDLNAAEGWPGVPRKVTRQLFDDKFLRCLADAVLDSTPGTGAYYNLSLSSISTDVEDSSLVFKHIWEQSTHPDSSDFLLHTVRVINIGTSPIDSVAMGCVYDVDVASDISNPPQNVSGDTVVSYGGKTWWLGWVAGNDVAIDTCSPNSEFYGVVVIDPGNLGNSFIRPRGAVMYNQAGFAYNVDNANEGGGDSLCQRYMWNLNVVTSTRRRDHDTLTGVWRDSAQPPPFEICGNLATGASYRADEGYIAVAKKVYNFPVNSGGSQLVARYGLNGLVAGTDSAFKGSGETYVVIHLASNNGLSGLLTNAQKGIDWYLKHANYQAGPYQDVLLRGDFNNDRILTPADGVAMLNFVYLHIYPHPSIGPFSDCVAEVNLDGIVTAADLVAVLGKIYVSPDTKCPWCLTRCP